jgi:hypothetical protein
MPKKASQIKLFACIPVLILLFTILPACRPEPLAPQNARVLIIDPPAESTRAINTVTVKTFVEKFDLVDKTGQSNKPGEGHIIYYLDETPPIEQGVSALTAEGTCAISTDTTYIWDGLQPGTHTFWAQLVNNDNTPLEPPAAVRVYVTVE